MQRMWQQLFAALASVLAVAGLASAQYPNTIPQPLPPAPPVWAPQTALPAQPLPAQIGSVPVIPAGAIHVKGSGGCSSCGSGGMTSTVPNGCYSQGCNNGCGSFKADCGFIFGSCKSFFNPCGVLPSSGGHGHGHGGAGAGGCGGGCGGAGGLGGHGGKCGTFIGQPYGTGFNGCAYDSYLNH